MTFHPTVSRSTGLLFSFLFGPSTWSRLFVLLGTHNDVFFFFPFFPVTCVWLSRPVAPYSTFVSLVLLPRDPPESPGVFVSFSLFSFPSNVLPHFSDGFPLSTRFRWPWFPLVYPLPVSLFFTSPPSLFFECFLLLFERMTFQSPPPFLTPITLTFPSPLCLTLFPPPKPE